MTMSHPTTSAHPQGQQNGTSGSSKNGTLVLAHREPESFISDEMGSEVVSLYIGDGPHQQVFTIHKNLLFGAGAIFEEMLSPKVLKAGQKMVLKNEGPIAFKLFVEYLYSRQVPGMRAGMTDVAKAERLRNLCQFYAFADKAELQFDVRNKIMDKIQDGFISIGKIPEPPLVQAIYEHTRPSSQLRKFCAASLVYHLRGPDYIDNGNLQTLMTENRECVDDFMEAVRKFVPNQDPRVRDCQSSENCAECAGNGERNQGKDGVWPCFFHLHKEITISGGGQGLKVEEGSSTAAEDGSHSSQEGCYLWIS